MKKILVIGGSGFVGRTLVPSLLAGGYKVSLLNRGNRVMKGITQYAADRENIRQMQEAAESAGNFDVVIDTSSYNRRHTEIAWDVFSGKTKHWIHLSSAAVYKEIADGYPGESDEIGGAVVWGEYGVEKSQADEFLIAHASKVPVTVLRPPYLYGPGNDNDRETFVWSRVLQGRPVIIPGNGKTCVQFLHVDDLVSAVHAVMEHRREVAVYNVGADERLMFREWVAMVAGITGASCAGVVAGNHAARWRPREYFPFRDYACCVEVGLIKRDLGWRAKYGIEEGFRQTFAAYSVEELRDRVLNTRVEDQILADEQIKRKRK